MVYSLMEMPPTKKPSKFQFMQTYQFSRRSDALAHFRIPTSSTQSNTMNEKSAADRMKWKTGAQTTTSVLLGRYQNAAVSIPISFCVFFSDVNL